ncbi:hypothetical protein Ddc_12870 [Ditylenchus destructor]|nr:hypothetical protein Ddc_12870 [Ditylenchus destructor]
MALTANQLFTTTKLHAIGTDIFQMIGIALTINIRTIAEWTGVDGSFILTDLSFLLTLLNSARPREDQYTLVSLSRDIIEHGFTAPPGNMPHFSLKPTPAPNLQLNGYH